MTEGAESTGRISKHAGGVTWAGQCTQAEEHTQSGCGFTLSNGRIGVVELVSELSTYAISTLYNFVDSHTSVG